MRFLHHIARSVNGLLRPVDLQLTRWSRTTNAQRVRLLRSLGIQTVIDVGANEGQYARTLRGDGYQGLIVSCEPAAAVFKELERACRRDARWTAYRVALGSTEGEAELGVSASTVFNSFLSATAAALAIDRDAAATSSEMVPITTLDTFVAEVRPTGPIGIKLDVQGYEAEILKGAEATLSRARYLELELSPEPVYEGEARMLAVMLQLEERKLLFAGAESAWMDKAGRAWQLNCFFVRR